MLQKTPYSFDVSVWEFFWPLIAGARLVLAAPEDHKDPERLAALIERYGITTLHFVPSMLKAFLEAADLSHCRSLRRVICSGEALSAELRDRFRGRLSAELHNLYGPTEASIDVTAWDCTRDEGRGVPIGLPIANTQIYLLDSAFNPVPIGVSGELYIGGVGLARGYLHRPDLTAAAFLPDPFGPPGGRLYRSGDLARYRPDGAIEYLGRLDQQVKVRGFRIELEEIEHRLLQHPGVKQAVVVAREERPGDKRLVAYLIPTKPPVDTVASVESLRVYVGTVLPDYMVPSAFVYLEALPLNPNGKLDRTRLPKPDVSAELAPQYVAPRTETEAQLAPIWAQVLRVERVGIHDNFFALGGDSILAIQVASRATQQGFTLTPRQIFQHQTVAALAQVAAHTEEIGPTERGERMEAPRFPLAELDPDAIEQLLVDDPSIEDVYPVAPMQEGMLFHTLMQPGTGVYIMQDRYELRGRIHIEAFREAWQRVADHHPILRTSFLWRTELRPHQIVHRDVKLPFEYFDWSGLEATEQEARLETMLETERRAGFDLARSPLLRIRLIRLTDDHYRCVRSFHHILLDEWCTSPLWLDFRTSYLALVQGQPPPALTAPPFRDYIAWLQRQDMEAAERFWRDYLRGFTEPT
ncbi:MAG: condensation domain-containing protein, partial [Gammaproteobacteria bacterium]